VRHSDRATQTNIDIVNLSVTSVDMCFGEAISAQNRLHLYALANEVGYTQY
jgi:hypothetical protein